MPPSTQPLLLTNCRLYTGEEVADGKSVRIENGVITAVGKRVDFPSDAETVDLGGMNVAPGFIDLQINGGGGRFFTQHPDAESLTAMYEANLRFGTTHFLPTVISSPLETVFRAVDAVEEARRAQQPGVLGLHVEGPYFHPARIGAHKREFIRQPATEELREIARRGRDVIKVITFAPELFTDDQLRLLRETGFVLSAGHSNATYEQATHFFQKGISKVTHLYNAMSALAHREPGLVGAVFEHPRVWTSIIVDGFHCHYAAVRVAKQLLKDKLFLITDAVDSADSAGAGHTHYGDFVTQYQYEAGRFVTGEGTLAGSCITMLDAVRNCVEHAGIPLAEALRMASAYPAAAIGLDHRLGYLKPGYRAALVIFDNALNVKAVYNDQSVINY